MNQLFYGDNLEVLRSEVADETVDLVYLDPPFNSQREYNVLFKNQSGQFSHAQIEAFDDTWKWGEEAEDTYLELTMSGEFPGELVDGVVALRQLLGESHMLAYLVMMAPRLIELRRVLKRHGTLYLHCDQAASHYLKVLLDLVFEPGNFLNEVTWRRTHHHGNVGKNFGKITDTLLVYARSASDHIWEQQYTPYDDEYVQKHFKHEDEDGRRWGSVSLRNPAERPNLQYAYEALNGVVYEPHPNGWIWSEPPWV